MTTEKRKGGGGKLNRSETVTVRLDPKLRYLAELAARRQRRTLSSYIEWAVEESLGSITEGPGEDEGESLKTLADELWDVDEADRLLLLVRNAPAFMTVDEQRIWKVTRESPYFLYGERDQHGRWHCIQSVDAVIMSRYREHYEAIKKVAMGELRPSDLPQWDEENALVAVRVERVKGGF